MNRLFVPGFAQRLVIGCLAALALPAAAESLAFVNVVVVPMDRDRILSGHTVLIDKGQIVALGPGALVDIPRDARRIDGSGRYLMPGLYEMHAHVPNSEPDIERVLSLFVANGVTTIRGMLGAPGHLGLRAELADGERLGPRLITSGPSLNGRSISGPQQAEVMIRSQHEAGYDFLKLHPGLKRDEFDAIAAEALRLGMPFAGHVSIDVGVHRALEAGQSCIDHLDGYMQALLRDDVSADDRRSGFFGLGLAQYVDESKIAVLAKKTAAAGVWNVATQTLIETFASTTSGGELAARDHMRYMPRATVARWRQAKDAFLADDAYDEAGAQRAVDVRRQLIKALHDAGAGLLLGSDAPQVFNVPGFASHEELNLLVASGLTPYQALRTGTASPAKYFHEQDRHGLVAEGYAADLVLLNKNPLKDVRNTAAIAGVMVNGRWLSRNDLDSLLARFDER